MESTYYSDRRDKPVRACCFPPDASRACHTLFHVDLVCGRCHARFSASRTTEVLSDSKYHLLDSCTCLAACVQEMGRATRHNTRVLLQFVFLSKSQKKIPQQNERFFIQTTLRHVFAHQTSVFLCVHTNTSLNIVEDMGCDQEEPSMETITVRHHYKPCRKPDTCKKKAGHF